MGNTNWMSFKRSEQLEMARNWIGLLVPNKVNWRIYEDDLEKLQTAHAAASTLILKPETSRTPADNAEIRAAFGGLTSTMRYIKKHYFLVPPLTEADLLRLGLKPDDHIHTPVPAPTGQATVETRYAGPAQLYVTFEHLKSTALNPKSAYGYKLAFKVCDADRTPPESGKELTETKFSRRKKILFTFEPENRGKKVYFSVRYENSKGEAGPWVPVTEAVVPF
jgi:hypothetical protein